MDLAYVLAKDIVKRARLTREVWAANQHDRCRLRYEVSLEDVRGRVHDPRHLRERWKLRELIAMERVPVEHTSSYLSFKRDAGGRCTCTQTGTASWRGRVWPEGKRQ